MAACNAGQQRNKHGGVVTASSIGERRRRKAAGKSCHHGSVCSSIVAHNYINHGANNVYATSRGGEQHHVTSVATFGLPTCVHDDMSKTRAATQRAAVYEKPRMANMAYQRQRNNGVTPRSRSACCNGVINALARSMTLSRAIAIFIFYRMAINFSRMTTM